AGARPGRPLSANETAPLLTPARRATSRIVGRRAILVTTSEAGSERGRSPPRDYRINQFSGTPIRVASDCLGEMSDGAQTPCPVVRLRADRPRRSLGVDRAAGGPGGRAGWGVH